MSKNLIMPDYENCIANLPNSILKKFGVETVGNTLPLLDKYLEKDYRNIVVFLLDGMGKVLMERHLSEDGAFRFHLKGIYKSTFLSTTVAATTSVLSGYAPCEHSWLGWDCYYPQIDKSVTVFLNTISGTEEPAADYNVAMTYTPYMDILQRINDAGKKACYALPFVPPFPDSFDKVCDRVRELCKEPEQKYIYAYWNEPDGLLHRNGCGAEVVGNEMLRMEKEISRLAKEHEDTLFVITADHGHIDSDSVVITDYPQICECFERMPSLEPRVLTLFIKKGKEKQFEEEFNKEFGDKFLLITTEEAIEKRLFGTGKPHELFRQMLGNYLAIATDNLSIYNDEEIWVSMHGSLTEDEMLIPLIVFNNKQ